MKDQTPNQSLKQFKDGRKMNRPRRLRQTSAIRELVAETRVSAKQLMQPIFIKEGLEKPQAIEGMPGVMQLPLDDLPAEIQKAKNAGIGAVMLFAVPKTRDSIGSEATNQEGILNRATRIAKEHAENKLVVMADLCLDEFTDHGHCGLVNEANEIDNDATLVRYQQMAVELAEAGADFVGTSGMMDNQVGAVREALEQEGFINTGILAYSAKYASSFYGPFRNAVDSELKGDRKSYQQDPRNIRESEKEILADLEQGADIVMIKPAMAHLDIVSLAKEISNVPVASYLVSGELAMLEAAAEKGWINREVAIDEMLHSIARAGADIICTYWAIEAANRWKS